MITTRFRHRVIYVLALMVAITSLIIFATVHSQAIQTQPAPITDDTEQIAQRNRKAERERQQRISELDAKMKNPGMLLLRAAEFDPLKTAPAALSIGNQQLQMTAPGAAKNQLELAAGQTSESAYLIVQFPDRILPEQTESLRTRGYEIKGYVANNAYIVKAPRTRQAQLMANKSREFRWVGAYGAGLKVQPELVKLADVAANTAQIEGDATTNIRVSFTTFSGEKSDGIRAAITALSLKNAANITDTFDGVITGFADVSPTELPKLITTLANLEGIEWIERKEKQRYENDNGVKIIQSGATGTDTPLFRNGLTGAGQIVGLADSGIDADHAQFKLSADASAQTLSYATTTTALMNGELPFAVTNPNNKILTYYLLGIGNLIDNANNPNGGKTLDPNETDSFGHLNAVAYDDNDGYHGTHTSSVLAGRDYNADGSGAVPGIPTRTSGDGMAPDARIVFQDVGHPAGELTGLSVGQRLLHQQAYNTGARIHTNSYGGSAGTAYGTDAANIDDLMWRLRDYTIFFSAGNSGPNATTLTKDTKNAILAGGASSPTNGGNAENVASGSSHGPTLDGRIKPDIVTLYTVRAATETSGLSSTFTYLTSTTANDAAVNPTSPNNNRTFSQISGTSFSSPMAAGGGTLVRQYFTDGFYPSGAKNAANSFNPSNALIKAMLINSGRNMTGTYTADNAPAGQSASLPSMGQGWGRMTLDDALYFPGDRRELKVLADVWNGATAADSARPATNPAIQTGQTHTYQINNVSTVEPLRITLVWTDPRGTAGASVALVNNLDLEVTDPQGKVFRGNVNFANAYSQPAGTTAFDNKNPLEAVYVRYPVPGAYTVKVIGANVPGSGQFGVIAQPGNQAIDSNKQGYALVATGNFTAGAVPIIVLNTTSVNGGVNADRFVGRNETVTATLNVSNATVVNATNITAQISVAASSQISASLVRINGLAAGQTATMTLGDIAGAASLTRAFQVTLLDNPSVTAGKTITFNVSLTPANGIASTTQFTITVAQRLITYRTRFEPTADPGEAGVIIIPEADWGLRPDNPNPAPTGNLFAGNWLLTTAVKAAGSTASIGDPSGVGTGYGTSSTSRADGFHDDTRWWTTKKIVLPGLNIDTATDRVANPAATAQLQAAVDSFDVDVNADFTGDTNNSIGDFTILRLRPYTNNSSISTTLDTGFNSNTNTNLLIADSSTASTNGFKHFGGSNFYQGTGVFTVDTLTPNNSDVAFRLELQFKRNGISQTGEGVFYDNLVMRLRVGDTTLYALPATITSATLNGASFLPTDNASGALLSTFGSGLPAGTTIDQPVTAFPIPTVVSGVSVRVNGILAPLFYVGAGARFGSNGAFQINYQLPYETAPGVALVEVLNNGTPVTSEFMNVKSNALGVFSYSSDGKGQGAGLNQDYQPNGTARPEMRGRVLQVFATGSGALLLDNATRQPAVPATGTAPPGDGSKLYVTSFTPTVTIGGIPAAVEFSGLAPGYVGLWQLNVRIPANAPTGNTVPLVFTVDGKNSNQTTVVVN